MTTYYVRGSGAAVSLTDKDFVAKGGEKSVYAKGPTAYCVYHDPAHAISPAKISELAVLTLPEIIKPVSELLDVKKRHCGETMPFVTDSFAPADSSIRPLVLCQLFTNAFRRKNGVTNDHVVKVTDAILHLTAHCHSKGVVMVDPNETNWLVKPTLDGVYLIDTSCFQTASFPGTAIKPAIRDWNAKAFARESDWFSMAVVLGWLWAGIHPYIAHHPEWQHLDSNAAMEPRMRKHVSFFDPATQFNRACRPLAEIPSALSGWLRAVLQDGKRVAPPSACGASVSIILPAITAPASVAGITLTKIGDYDADIVGVYGDIVITAGAQSKTIIVRTPVKAIPIAAAEHNRTLHLEDWKTKAAIPITVSADSVLESEGRIYAVSGGVVNEVVFNELASGVRATVKHVGSIADLPSTRVFPGCIVQNLLGRYLLSVFPESGKCQQHQLRELEGWQILGAKYERGVFVAMVEQSGTYRHWLYRFSGDKQDSQQIGDQFGDVNFCVTERGACVIMEPNGTLRITMNTPGNHSLKRIACPLADGDLFSDGAAVLAAVGKTLYRLSLTK